MHRKVIHTADGSATIQLTDLDEHYHSTHGALQEAKHVFIDNGISKIKQENISVFELGFGTGLNAILTLAHAHTNNIAIDYLGLEAYPVEEELLIELNYQELIPEFAREFTRLNTCNWSEKCDVTEQFSLLKVKQKIQDFQPAIEKFDIVYFDAFGHRAQSEMWELEVIEKMYAMLKPGGVFVTYAARGQLKRDLISLGFKVEKLPGPPGKREMTFAIKQ